MRMKGLRDSYRFVQFVRHDVLRTYIIHDCHQESDVIVYLTRLACWELPLPGLG